MSGRRLKDNQDAGEHDVYVRLALAFGWTKSQVDAEEADYIREVMVALDARGEVQAAQQKAQGQG